MVQLQFVPPHISCFGHNLVVDTLIDLPELIGTMTMLSVIVVQNHPAQVASSFDIVLINMHVGIAGVQATYLYTRELEVVVIFKAFRV